MNCGKLLKRWEYQTTLTASWETCMQVKKQQLEPDMAQQTGSKLGKDYIKAVYCHPAYLTYIQSTSCKMPGWMGEISITSEMHWHHRYDWKWRGTEEPLNESERESEKFGLKLNIQKTKIMASSLHFMANRWGTTKTVRDFIFLDSTVTADGDCSHGIKRCLLFGRKTMTNIDSILKGRDIILPTKFHLVKAMVFPVVIRKLSAEELMLLNCGVGEDSWEFLQLQGDPTSPY